MKTLRNLALVAASGLATASPAFAQSTGPDYSTLTGAVNFTSTQQAILSVGVLVIGIAVVVVGVRKIVRMIKGA